MKKIISMLLAAAMLLSLAACQKKDIGEPGSLEGDLSAEGSASIEEVPPLDEKSYHPLGVGYYKGLGINPYTCTNAQNQTITGLVYEGLFELDDQFQPVPCLAGNISVKVKKSTKEQVVEEKKDDKATTATKTTAKNQADANKTAAKPGESSGDTSEEEKPKTIRVTTYTTYVTLTLRKGVRFSDGAGLHADDVVYSLEQAAANGSIYKSRLARFQKLAASGKDTVTFTVNGALADVACLLTFPIVKNGTAEDDFPVGTGPYVPQLKRNTFRRLTANESWWRRGLEEGTENGEGSETLLSGPIISQPVPEIKVLTYEDSDDLVFGFTSSQVCGAAVDFTDPDALQYSGSYSVTDYPTSTLLYLGCNTVKGSFCHSQTLRQALYRAVDRENFATRMMARHALGTALPVSPRSKWYSQELEEALGYDPAAAKELVDKANVKGTLRLIVNQESTFKCAAAEELKKEFGQLGVSVSVEQLTWKAFRLAIKNGDYDLYLGEVTLDGNFDLARLICTGGSMNFSGYTHQGLDDAHQSYHAATDKLVEVEGEKVSQKEQAAKEYFTELAHRAPIIPLGFKNGSLLTKDTVLTNAMPTQQTIYARLWRWKVEPGVAEASQ